jgi:baculoviral IAP repeat-containing protein 6
VQRVRLEDDAVHIQLVVSEAFRCGDSPLRLVLSISERSSYPSSDALLYVEDGGSETMDGIVEEVAGSLGGDVRLHRVLRKLCEAFMVEARFPAPAAAGAGGGGGAAAAAAAPSAAAAMDVEGAGSASASGGGSDGDDGSDDDDNGADDDDGSDDGDYGYDELLEENNWESLQRTKRRWEERETERSGKRQAVGAGQPVAAGKWPTGGASGRPGASAGSGAAAAPKNEMFSSRESFRMLSNELFQIISKTNAKAGKIVSAEAVGDDVHHWRVRLADFAGELGEDLKQIETLYGYNHVEIEFTFTPDLHPFFPPQVKIVRPRFKGWILGAVMTHPMFVLSGWDPMRSTQAVIDHVRELLQSFGRIEVDSQRNDADAFPHSAYSPLENVLIKMELLTSTRPRAADRYQEMYADRDKEIDKDRLKMFRNLSKKDVKADPKAKEGQQKQYWASGTGYGHTGAGKGEVWDSKAAVAAQKHQDELRADVLQELLSADRLSRHGSGGAAAAATNDAEKSLLAGLVDAAPRDRDFVLDSCLIPFLEAEILHTTLQDMGVRFSYYSAVMKAARTCLEMEWLRPNLQKLGNGLSELSDQSTIFQVSVGGREFADKVAAARAAEANGTQSARATASRDLMPKGMARKPKEPPELAGWQQMSDLLQLADTVQRVASYGKEVLADAAAAATAAAPSAAAAAAAAGGSGGGAAAASPEATEQQEIGRQYSAALDSHRFQFVSELAQIAGAPGATAAARGPSGGSGRMRRLASEAASCQKNLPLDLSSSCFVRVDENRIDHWHALISGPEDTPYEGGCFIFDIVCGPDYPNAAPKVLLFTTGGGTVRFNPNLYNCGEKTEALFEPFIYKMHYFTKTGSGRT